MKKAIKGLAAVLAAGMLAGCAGSASQQQPQAQGFAPSLDTNASLTLEIAGFLGNFEALDQVVNNFNEIYPNVIITYEQNGAEKLAAYLENNRHVDIFMTADVNLRYPDQPERYVADQCEDLAAAGVDTSAVRPEMMASCVYDGKTLRLPLGGAVSGMAVNKTLLEKEGLSVPTNYPDFLNTLAALKEKGYTPIQGGGTRVYTGLVVNEILAQLGSDEALLQAVKNGEESAQDVLAAAFAQESEILQAGYTDTALNAEYPEDNYDGAIMNFFEGDVPFWFCSSENFGGTKKRETKSEAFTANPFEYEFSYIPMGENGVYAYSESWNGFSVNKNSDSKDYAIEFMRFLAQDDQMQIMAQIKGMPTVTATNSDERYESVCSAPQVQLAYTNDGSIESYVRSNVESVAYGFAMGQIATPEAAAQKVLSLCAQTTQKMAG